MNWCGEVSEAWVFCFSSLTWTFACSKHEEQFWWTLAKMSGTWGGHKHITLLSLCWASKGFLEASKRNLQFPAKKRSICQRPPRGLWRHREAVNLLSEHQKKDLLETSDRYVQFSVQNRNAFGKPAGGLLKVLEGHVWHPFKAWYPVQYTLHPS